MPSHHIIPNSFFMTFNPEVSLLEDTSEKTALELHRRVSHHLSLTTNPAVKLKRVRFHNLVHDSQLKKQSRIPSSWKTISIRDFELHRFPRSSLFSEAGSRPKPLEQADDVIEWSTSTPGCSKWRAFLEVELKFQWLVWIVLPQIDDGEFHS